MIRALKSSILAVAMAVGTAGVASADSIPGLRGHDHTGITVPDIKQAVEFFTEVVGCKQVMAFGPFADPKGTFMKDLLGVDPKAVIHQITMVRCGTGSNIELFQYSAPDQKDVQTKNSDVGAFHIAFYVDDIKAAKAYLEIEGRPHALGAVCRHPGPRGRPEHLLFPGALGPTARSDQLSERHGL